MRNRVAGSLRAVETSREFEGEAANITANQTTGSIVSRRTLTLQGKTDESDAHERGKDLYTIKSRPYRINRTESKDHMGPSG